MLTLKELPPNISQSYLDKVKEIQLQPFTEAECFELFKSRLSKPTDAELNNLINALHIPIQDRIPKKLGSIIDYLAKKQLNFKKPKAVITELERNPINLESIYNN